MRFAAAWQLALLTLACCHPSQTAVSPEAWVTIRDARIAVEVADSVPEQTLGLGRRGDLAWNRGMLFVYDEPGFYGFWMKDMHFDIDIVWIFGDRIVDITRRVPYPVSGGGPTYRPSQLCDSVLEVPAGAAEAHGWRIGDRVEVDWSTRR